MFHTITSYTKEYATKTYQDCWHVFYISEEHRNIATWPWHKACNEVILDPPAAVETDSGN